ncbi:amidase [Virgibacillus natechei]|uniref:Amidase n=1 Tax=Virgibacillus natechei TaxID=1216297 RepID=A0ABS4IHM1_9BACI|nr:amidase [Virgibacillus natechei]MBP1970450.1 amidase [Virgibacillus natechei]UZD13899.1 amidase [Virgibacillus natechei]
MDLHTYVNLDATALAERVKAKEITPRELLELGFQQLEKMNPSLNAVTHSRKEKALAEAERIDVEASPFAGVPILLKNLSQRLTDEPLTSGSPLLMSTVSAHDSHFVKKFREAGFQFMGHTNTPEFGLKNITEPDLHGPSRNPWNTDYSPGGSSGGAAAAVASGMVPIAGASDGGGSIRIPASFTGLFGLKPTRGRTPVGPGAGRQWQGASIDFILSKSVRDSAAMLDELQVVQPEAAFHTPLFPASYKTAMKDSFERPLRIAFSTKSPVGTPVSEDAKTAVKNTVRWLEREGHIVEEKENGVDGIQLMKDYYLMNSGEISSLVRGLEKGIGRAITADDVEIETWMLNQAGKSVSAAEFSASLSSWDTAAAHMATLHETYDFYITPATAYTAPKVGELTYSRQEQMKLRAQMNELAKQEQQALVYDLFLPSLTYTPFTQLANLTGQPAMSVPVHLSDEGLPLGVQVMASKGEENRLLQLAYQLEQSELWIDIKQLVADPVLAKHNSKRAIHE